MNALIRFFISSSRSSSDQSFLSHNLAGLELVPQTFLDPISSVWLEWSLKLRHHYLRHPSEESGRYLYQDHVLNQEIEQGLKQMGLNAEDMEELCDLLDEVIGDKDNKKNEG